MFQIIQIPHPFFKRVKNNLYAKVNLTLEEVNLQNY